MASVVKFRPFKIPNVVNTQFFSGDIERHREFMTEDLSRSGLEQGDMHAYVHPMLRLNEGALAGYGIPYFGLDGQPLTNESGELIMFRVRMKYPQFSKEQRYAQPSGAQLAKYNLPPHLPYIHPLTLELEGEEMICAEGEKKAASVIRNLGLPAFGIGGCQMWRNPDGSGTVHPWITALLRQRNIDRLTIIPDGDVFRYDICSAYGTFARALQAEGFQVRILNPGDKIDDLLVRWGEEKHDRFAAIPPIDADQLVQSPSSLVKKYGLAFRVGPKDQPVVHQHTSNIMRLMEEHSAFPSVWRNLDNNRVMVGDDPATPDLTEMDIANYFQHNLGFDKVTHRLVYSCVQALAKKNARSPMLDYIRGCDWDGNPRLDTWMSRLWGVDDSPFHREVAAKWLISACARMDRPGTKIDWMMIVVGPQGTGKTSMPNLLFNGNALTMYGDHNDKDLHMLLHSALCVGFDELDSFGKRESSNLKAMITRNEDAFRPPYGASVEVFPRRFTLYGCGNRYEFLQHDPSGYRRYAIVEVSRLLDFRGLEGERDQLWAEAWTRYSRGEKFWEVSGTSEVAQKYTIANPLEDKILNVMHGWSKDKSGFVRDGILYFTMTLLLERIDMGREVKNTNVTRDVASILRGLGCEQGNGSNPTGVRGRFYKIPVSALK